MTKPGNVSMPSSGAGINRYFSDYKSKLQIAPGHVIVLTIIVAVMVLLLRHFGPGWFGIP